MIIREKLLVFVVGCTCILLTGCTSGGKDPFSPSKFYFGSDLSYVNQILDKNGVYKDEGVEKDPYIIFAEHGTNLARFRLWHNPRWTKNVYGGQGTQLYNDLKDVEESIRRSRDLGMAILLDFHYSDTWADPGKQTVPAAWIGIQDIQVLEDSVYNYTFQTMSYLKSRGLLPEFVQIGNETNCGMLYDNASNEFPPCNNCEGNWENLGQVINAGIRAVRDVAKRDTWVVLHVADPKNINWWFDGITGPGEVTDFEVIGFSYYPIWHTSVGLSRLSNSISGFRTKYEKEVMILEIAYPWTTQGNDNYNNIFGSGTETSGYPFTEEGQFNLLTAATQAVIDGGGLGVVYWEPAWITSDLQDLWGKGSSWENNTFFDFSGNANRSIDYPGYEYIFPED